MLLVAVPSGRMPLWPHVSNLDILGLVGRPLMCTDVRCVASAAKLLGVVKLRESLDARDAFDVKSRVDEQFALCAMPNGKVPHQKVFSSFFHSKCLVCSCQECYDCEEARK